MYRIGWLLSCLLFSLSMASFPAERSTAEIRTRLSKPEIYLGDPVSYTIEVVHPSNASVSFPAIGTQLGEIEVLSSRTSRNILPGGISTVDVLDLTITGYRLGKIDLPPLAITLTRKDGTIETLTTRLTPVQVKPMLGEAPDQSIGLRDLKSVLDVGGPPKSQFVFLIIVALLIGASGTGFYFFRRSRVTSSAENVGGVISPIEEALQEIEKLWASQLFKEKAKLFHAMLSAVIKDYLEKRYGLKTKERTTREIVFQMAHQELDQELIKRTKDVFKICDLIKFSKYYPSEAESKWLVEQAVTIIKCDRAIA